MRRNIILCFPLMVLLFSNCTLGPEYRRSADLPVPTAFRGQADGKEASSIADLTWWDFFHDQDLNSLIRVALANNLDLRRAASRVAEFRARLQGTNARLNPELSVGLTTNPTSFVPNDFGIFQSGLQLSWEIDFFGRLKRSTEAATADLLASEEGQRGIITSLVGDVGRVWFELRQLDEQLSVTRRTVKAQEEALELVRLLNREGINSGAEVRQAENQLATTAAQVPALERQIGDKENELRLLLGTTPDAVLRPSGPAETYSAPVVPVGLPAQLLERRPDVRQAERQLMAATARIGQAKAVTIPFPQIGLTGFLGGASIELMEIFSHGLTALGPTMNMPLFDSGRRSADVAAVVAQTEQADLFYRQTILQALREVADALGDNRKYLEELNQHNKRVVAGREYQRLTELRFRSGVASYLEVLDAQRQLYASEIDLVRTRLNRQLAIVRLYRALGGGWTDEHDRGPQNTNPEK